MKSIENILPFTRRQPRPDSIDRDFMPAALEIVETPPSPIGRALAYTIMALFAVAIAWACLGKVDIVASAKGKIVPSGRTKVIQPFETGVVGAIHVRDGQVVKAGDPLIELDPTLNEADSKHAQHDLMAAQLDVARLKAALTDDPLKAFDPPADAPAEILEIQHRLLVDQTAEQQEKLAVLDRQHDQKAAERETAGATIEKLEASLPVMADRLEIRRTLYEHNTGSKANYLELLQPYVEEQHDLEVQKRHYDEATAALALIGEQRKQAIEEYQRTRLGELVEAERKAAGLSEDLVKAQHRAALQILTAPVDGTVQQLAVHTVGGVVTPAQTLLTVVPLDAPLEIEATVQNSDVGFLRVGQPAEIKVDTFNFNRYGLLHGNVEDVSADSIPRDRAERPNSAARARDADTSEPTDVDLVYTARITLTTRQMMVDGNMVDLAPGMAVTTEIKTGERRIISYLLSPLLRFKQESFRER
jgi:hemolysin D